jgi:hypothetical protein
MEQYFALWLKKTNREYNANHRIQFILPSAILDSELSPEQLKKQYPNFVLKPGATDSGYAKWVATKESDMNGGSCKL